MEPIVVDGAFGPVTFSAFDGQHAVGPLQPGQLDDLEARHNVRLPDDYRAFMLKLNGAKPSPRGVAYRYDDAAIETLKKILAPDDEILTEPMATVRYFYAVGHPSASLDVSKMQVHVDAWGRPGLLTIGATAHHGELVMDLAEGDGHGSIHIMLFEGIAQLVENGIDVPLAYVAPNFTALLAMFFDIDEIHDQRFEEHLKSIGGDIFSSAPRR